MILSLPLSLPDATPIGDQHAMQTRAGITYYFYNLEPYDCHPAGDRRAMLLRAAKLQVVSGVRQRVYPINNRGAADSRPPATPCTWPKRSAWPR